MPDTESTETKYFRTFREENDKLYNGRLKFKTYEEGKQHLLEHGFTRVQPNRAELQDTFLGPQTGNRVYLKQG